MTIVYAPAGWSLAAAIAGGHSAAVCGLQAVRHGPAEDRLAGSLSGEPVHRLLNDPQRQVIAGARVIIPGPGLAADPQGRLIAQAEHVPIHVGALPFAARAVTEYFGDTIRPGDVLGALTADAGFTREQIGKISVNDFSTYVAVDRKIAHDVVARLNSGKIKGRTVKARLLKD